LQDPPRVVEGHGAGGVEEDAERCGSGALGRAVHAHDEIIDLLAEADRAQRALGPAQLGGHQDLDGVVGQVAISSAGRLHRVLRSDLERLLEARGDLRLAQIHARWSPGRRKELTARGRGRNSDGQRKREGHHVFQDDEAEHTAENASALLLFLAVRGADARTRRDASPPLSIEKHSISARTCRTSKHRRGDLAGRMHLSARRRRQGMKPFVINRYGRMVFPFSFFPELDFSVFETLDQFAAVIRRDFEDKAPSENDIVSKVDAGDYTSRYELLRDLALNLFWVNRYAMTMYEKRPTRW